MEPTARKPGDRNFGWLFWEPPWFRTLYVAGVVGQIIAALFAGFFVTGNWLLELSHKQSWWHFSLLAGVSVIVLLGMMRETYGRRIGPFGIFVMSFAIVVGAIHLLSKPA